MARPRKGKREKRVRDKTREFIDLILTTIETRESARRRVETEVDKAVERAWCQATALRCGFPVETADAMLDHGLGCIEIADLLRASVRGRVM